MYVRKTEAVRSVHYSVLIGHLSVASRGHLEETMECLTAHTARAVEWMVLNNARYILSFSNDYLETFVHRLFVTC